MTRNMTRFMGHFRWPALFIASFCFLALMLYLYGLSQPTFPREIMAADGAPMALIPAGGFTMGTKDGEANERPMHRVYLDAFYIDAFEVTVAKYAKFLAAHQREKPFKWSDANLVRDGERPVIGVTWFDAQAYCNWADKRLPTEAEWEKAARGTDARTFPWGNEEPSANDGNFGHCCKWQGYATLAPVGSFEADVSPYGIYDMEGNASEWTADWYSPTYYEASRVANPPGPSIAEKTDPYSLDFSRKKTIRGGSWVSGISGLRVTSRGGSDPASRHGDVGFRCAKDIAR